MVMGEERQMEKFAEYGYNFATPKDAVDAKIYDMKLYSVISCAWLPCQCFSDTSLNNYLQDGTLFEEPIKCHPGWMLAELTGFAPSKGAIYCTQNGQFQKYHNTQNYGSIREYYQNYGWTSFEPIPYQSLELDHNTKVEEPHNTKVEKPHHAIDKAREIIYGDREATYGHPGANLARIAKIWSVIFGVGVTEEQVSWAMVGLKMAREINKPDDDNIVDAIGYLALIDRVREYNVEHYEAS